MSEGDNCRTHQDDVNEPDVGRDEMNLSEFPIALPGDRSPRGRHTLVFEDQVWDKSRREKVTRRVTVAASESYGLPTALDDEVLVGLIQLTRRAVPLSRTVFFTRYQLIDLLGWRREGKSYRRLETSLKRWAGVTLYYDKAWWDKAAKSWVSESFHVLEQVTLYDREQCTKANSQEGRSPLSSFTWNTVMFKSFEDGYLKRLDLRLYRRLHSAVAKRMYRFLDKRFYHRQRWSFDLRMFACEHVGLSRVHDNSQLKRKLASAISELENIGYLQPLGKSDRYQQLARGKWEIVFQRSNRHASENDVSTDPQEDTSLYQDLTSRGVTPTAAKRLVADYAEDRIREKIELVDWVRSSNARAIPNPGGYLAAAIRDNYTPPPAFETKAQRAERQKRARDRRNQEDLARRLRDTVANAKQQQTTQRVQQYLESLPAGERKRIEDEAVDNGPQLLRHFYLENLRNQSGLAERYRWQMVEKHVLRLLRERKPTAREVSAKQE